MIIIAVKAGTACGIKRLFEDIMSEYSYNQRHLDDKLKERLESAEKQEEKKDTAIAKMISQYDEYLYKA